MEMKKVWAMYFSPTGGTEKVVRGTADALAAKLNLPVEVYDFTLPQVREKEAVFGEGDIVVVGTPVIAGRVPNVLLPYLEGKIKGNGALAVPMVSFGNRNFDDALIELRNLMEANGFKTVAGGAFISEHSFSKTLAAGRPDEKSFVPPTTIIPVTLFLLLITVSSCCNRSFDLPDCFLLSSILSLSL